MRFTNPRQRAAVMLNILSRAAEGIQRGARKAGHAIATAGSGPATQTVRGSGKELAYSGKDYLVEGLEGLPWMQVLAKEGESRKIREMAQFRKVFGHLLGKKAAKEVTASVARGDSALVKATPGLLRPLVRGASVGSKVLTDVVAKKIDAGLEAIMGGSHARRGSYWGSAIDKQLRLDDFFRKSGKDLLSINFQRKGKEALRPFRPLANKISGKLKTTTLRKELQNIKIEEDALYNDRVAKALKKLNTLNFKSPEHAARAKENTTAFIRQASVNSKKRRIRETLLNFGNEEMRKEGKFYADQPIVYREPGSLSRVRAWLGADKESRGAVQSIGQTRDLQRVSSAKRKEYTAIINKGIQDRLASDVALNAKVTKLKSKLKTSDNVLDADDYTTTMAGLRAEEIFKLIQKADTSNNPTEVASIIKHVGKPVQVTKQTPYGTTKVDWIFDRNAGTEKDPFRKVLESRYMGNPDVSLVTTAGVTAGAVVGGTQYVKEQAKELRAKRRQKESKLTDKAMKLLYRAEYKSAHPDADEWEISEFVERKMIAGKATQEWANRMSANRALLSANVGNIFNPYNYQPSVPNVQLPSFTGVTTITPATPVSYVLGNSASRKKERINESSLNKIRKAFSSPKKQTNKKSSKKK